MMVTFSKVRISVRGSYCDSAPQVPKNLAIVLNAVVVWLVHKVKPSDLSETTVDQICCKEASHNLLKFHTK